VPNVIKIGQAVAEIWRFNGLFQNGGRPPSWTTHDDYVVVSVVMQNLVEINAVVSII